MLQKSNSQYDSFLYWRQPIPALDLSELEDVGVADGKLANGKQAGKQEASKVPRKETTAEEEEQPEYSTFNYWRDPIARVDALDFSLLL